ncbi:KCU-star family selenoprotein [Helicobacter mesocricetorum]|uniref:KCU-star family selenoprotein n=1 Tax=Helicobacter mesocricetorum TaxID=87012 RepID=UPI000CF05BD5|nr:KCU-star family selenoprotein [Helicobacter mesocricetorum]
MNGLLKAISFIKKIYQKSDRFLYLLVGLPSYDKYKEYMSRHRPNETIKTQEEFFKEAMDNKYGSKGNPKCC